MADGSFAEVAEGAAGSVPLSTRFSLERAAVLVVDGDNMSMEIVGQVLSGFGARRITRCVNAATARTVLAKEIFDLILVEPGTIGEDGVEFAAWLRRDCLPPNRFAPLLFITGHTPRSRIGAARDSGVNFVVAKPITPSILIERILWMARSRRPYVDCDAFCGPDRRFKFTGPPPGLDGRRSDDLPAEVGDAAEPNLSQDAIDAMMQPRRSGR